MPPAAHLAVWVQPGASRQRVAGMMGDAVKIAVTAPPEKGKANQAVERLLAEEFGISAGAVAVIAGGGSRRKTVRLNGIGPERLRSWLSRHMPKG